MEDEVLITDGELDTGDWYKNLVEAHTTKLPEGAVTVKMFVEDTGLSGATARQILKEKMENDPNFHGEKRSVNGYNRWVFWREGGQE